MSERAGSVLVDIAAYDGMVSTCGHGTLELVGSTQHNSPHYARLYNGCGGRICGIVMRRAACNFEALVCVYGVCAA